MGSVIRATVALCQAGPSTVMLGQNFSDFPATDAFNGRIVSPRIQSKTDEPCRTLLDNALKKGPGTVVHLPSSVARDHFFIYDTERLSRYNRWRTSAADEDLLSLAQKLVAIDSAHEVATRAGIAG